MKKYVAIVIVGIIITGFIISLYNPLDLSKVISMSFSFKSFVVCLFLIIISLLLSYVGIPFYLVWLIIDLLSLGMLSSYFWSAFFIKGIILSLILLLLKIPIWFLLFLNSFYSLKLIKNNYIYLFYRYLANRKNSFLYLKKLLIVSGGIAVVNCLNVILGNKLIIPIANYLLF